jgi:TRAP-type mannitol/chloroaromatic compound transport system substrate-binding protein
MVTRRGLVLGVVGATAVSGAARRVRAAAEHRWKWQSFWQPNTVNQLAFERFAARVKERSGGRIEIEALPVNAVVPPGEVLDAVRAGVLQGANGGTGYYVGKDPAFALLADLNCAWENPDQLIGWYYEGGGNALARELYARFGSYYLGPVLWGMESIPTKKPLRSIADFKGLKMRAPEGLGAAIWAKLGVGVITLPGTEVYTALERGRIEATDWGSIGMNDQLGYGKIAPFAIYPGIHSMPASDVTIKLDIWEKLPQDLKTILLEETVEFNRHSLEVNEKLDREMVAKRDPTTLIAWGPAERRELREVARTVWEEWGKKSPMAQKVYDSYLAYMKKTGLL